MKITSNRVRLLVISLLMVIGGVSASGCSSGQTPIQKTATSITVYNDSLQTLITLRQQNLISDSEYKIIDALRVQAYTAIQTEEKYALAGDTLSLASFDNQFNSAVDAFIAEVLKVKGN